jgi:hypothetical protein
LYCTGTVKENVARWTGGWWLISAFRFRGTPSSRVFYRMKYGKHSSSKLKRINRFY